MMRRVNVNLPDDLREELVLLSKQTGEGVSGMIREGVRRVVIEYERGDRRR